MAASKAGLVNQQFYHAKLLLQMQQQLSHEPEVSAKHLALDNAVTQCLLLALQGFLQELAESCQLPNMPNTLIELEQLMQQEKKQHPILQELLLLQQQDSWLGQLLAAKQNLLTRSQAQMATPGNKQLLAVSLVDDKQISLPQLLEQMQKFVQNQREYLQEY